MKNLVFVTDTWEEQNTNGVVTYIRNIRSRLEEQGFNVTVIHPGQFAHHFPLPTYPEIKMTLSTRAHMETLIQEAKPDYIHLATEGSLGFIARSACIKNKWQFTSYYHTRLPEYVGVRFKPLGKPTALYMKWFHEASSCVMVSTETLKQELSDKGFKKIAVSPLGVDLDMFHKNPHARLPEGMSHPVFMFMGRIAPEKTLEKFLDCDLPGAKMVIGDGPSKQSLETQYPNVLFTGYKGGQELVDLLSVSDVFVFPSLTDTFSLAIIETLACGVPIAAYDVQGPKNIITNGYDGFLGEDLKTNTLKCLEIDRNNCVETAKKYSWDRAVSRFTENLVTLL